MFVLSLCSITVAQNKKRDNDSQRIKIDKDKPSVYLVAETNVKLKKLADADDGILLRFHNNSRWAIWLQASGGSDYADASLFYKVFKKSILEHSKICHACSVIPLKPGKSISFSIPKKHLAEGLSLRVQFDFDWGQDWFIDGEPIHFVQFYSSDLPPSINENKRQ